MDEVYEYCVRMLGAGAVAIHASHEAFVAGGSDRIDRMAGAVQACRSRAGETAAADLGGGGTAGTLADSVAREIADAAARLPVDQREALALRDLVGLSHQQIASVLQISPYAAGMLVARARLALRARRRGVEEEPDDSCPDRERALTMIVRRQDGEPIASEDEDWVLEHVGSCEACSRVHASMLEASVCYRAWRTPDPAATRPAGRGRGDAGDGESQDVVGDAMP
ncbi:MAG: sigma-70 region 4 domain-containing protein [Solirubrobacteraceae bacterium]